VRGCPRRRLSTGDCDDDYYIIIFIVDDGG
jgi:hypothetical protein